DQETNDLTKAINFAKGKGFYSPIIIGATGLREDHTLGNISLLTQYTGLFEHICMVSDYGIFHSISETTSFECSPGQQVSLFSIFPFGIISTRGLKYPIHKRNLPVWWEGTLNETTDSRFTIEIEGKGSVLVYLCHPSK
ncbi:MAG: thiamine diphosphokinase, partial [Bacteroidales bacterium]